MTGAGAPIMKRFPPGGVRSLPGDPGSPACGPGAPAVGFRRPARVRPARPPAERVAPASAAYAGCGSVPGTVPPPAAGLACGCPRQQGPGPALLIQWQRRRALPCPPPATVPPCRAPPRRQRSCPVPSPRRLRSRLAATAAAGRGAAQLRPPPQTGALPGRAPRHRRQCPAAPLPPVEALPCRRPAGRPQAPAPPPRLPRRTRRLRPPSAAAFPRARRCRVFPRRLCSG